MSPPPRGRLRDHGLGLCFGSLFLVSLVGQAVAGWNDFNNRQLSEHFDPVSIGRYLTSSEFAVDVAENWQSEYLQFLLYIFATVWFIQLGSAESKEPDKSGTESDQDQMVGPYATSDSPGWARSGGLKTAVYSRSLGLVMGLIFLGSWAAQSIAGQAAFNREQLMNLQDPLTWLHYVGSADFWSRSLQNWQSEFLAVGSMAVLSIYLRQRGSPESKPVGAAHDSTGQTG